MWFPTFLLTIQQTIVKQNVSRQGAKAQQAKYGGFEQDTTERAENSYRYCLWFLLFELVIGPQRCFH